MFSKVTLGLLALIHVKIKTHGFLHIIFCFCVRSSRFSNANWFQTINPHHQLTTKKKVKVIKIHQKSTVNYTLPHQITRNSLPQGFPRSLSPLGLGGDRYILKKTHTSPCLHDFLKFRAVILGPGMFLENHHLWLWIRSDPNQST